ncbi:hypothetical protein [Halomonas sp. AOP42-A1-14]|uniref:hypothetical protein n=1 Tax=Halomonas sp. AOP42-A1-14 TaxID=3457676 RepID=UPI004034548F
MSDDFDPATELQRLQDLKRLRRQRPYWRGRSQLDPYTAELLALHDQGATPADLRDWLAMPPRRLSVHHSTVSRWLRRTLAQRQADRRGNR